MRCWLVCGLAAAAIGAGPVIAEEAPPTADMATVEGVVGGAVPRGVLRARG